MVDRMPRDITAADADGEKAAPAAGLSPGRHLIAVMLLTAAVLDLTRCGLVLAAARHPATTPGLAAAVLSVRTARGCQAGRRWAGLAALLIGAASAPQAAMSGFRSRIRPLTRPPLSWGFCLPWLSWPPPVRPGNRSNTPKTRAPSTGPVTRSNRLSFPHRPCRWLAGRSTRTRRSRPALRAGHRRGSVLAGGTRRHCRRCPPGVWPHTRRFPPPGCRPS
jgi:hypothetical protein